MTVLERKRRQRQLGRPVTIRVKILRRAFEVAGTDAQALFIKWLRKMKLME
jgi:hypothetical protein